MSWTVDQLLRDPGLRVRAVVHAHGARPISWVHPTELPDPAPYLRGGEVVLSTGMWLDTGTPVRAFVSALAESGVVAVGFGLSVGHPAIPSGLEEACRENGLTLFEVPLDVSFQTLVRAFVLHSTREGVVPLRAAVRHNQAFVSALGEGKGIPGVLEILRRDLGSDTHLWDRRAQQIAGTTTADPGLVDRAWESARRRDQRFDLEGSAVVPIGPRGAREALLFIERPLQRMSAADVAEVEQAVSFIGLELGDARQYGRPSAASLPTSSKVSLRRMSTEPRSIGTWPCWASSPTRPCSSSSAASRTVRSRSIVSMRPSAASGSDRAAALRRVAW